MIEARRNRWAAAGLDFYNRRILRSAFASIRVAGLDSIRSIDGPVIAAPNHSCWWDGCVDLFLSRNVLRAPTYVMMGETQLRKHRVFSSIGIFSVPDDGGSMLPTLRYAERLLRSERCVLWMYPQGEMAAARSPIEIREGSLLLAQRTGATIVPLAQRYEFVAEDHPEVFVRVGSPLVGMRRDVESAERLGASMTSLLERVDDDLRHRRVGEYEVVMQGKLSRDRRLDAFQGDRAIKRSTI